MSITLREYVPLDSFTTFGVPSVARWFASVTNEHDIRELLRSPIFTHAHRLIIGGGSNMLLIGDVHALVIHNECFGREVLQEDDETVLIRFCSGEEWHSCVEWCVSQGYAGLENLALIPGTVGAAPIQNIGAYGAEVESVIERVHVVNFETGTSESIPREQCRFGYRDSIFKNELHDACFITAVDFRLRKHSAANVRYAELQRELSERGSTSPGIRDVFDAVVAIRTRKLPNVRVLGNSGSFFKNPVVSEQKANELRVLYPHMPSFAAENGVKLSAAWLIEQSGCKGIRRGDAGVYEKHALVLVNHGHATGAEIRALAQEVQNTVREKFAVHLEMEVRIVDVHEAPPTNVDAERT
ncbi:MAG: UDP-N-acetylmuramate dehydrogenase [Candidatus Kapaibacterium sp.]|jgi:UDP-N-acetylmuramate dehydrogenase